LSYLAEVVADNPVHYWRCADPGGGLGHDIGSVPVHIHSVGTPTFGYSGPNSDGGSLDCCLDGQFANTGEAIAHAGGQMSLEAIVWVWQALASARFFVAFVNGGAFFSLQRSGTQWQALYNNIGANSAANYTGKAWHHLAMTFDLANVRLYVDGSQRAITAAAPSAPFNAIVEVCSSPTQTLFGNSFVSELAEYTVALSAARVLAHFNAIDQVGQAPVYTQAGSFSPSTGSGAPLSSVLPYVSRTYQNAP
jgi:hypothetical protein